MTVFTDLSAFASVPRVTSLRLAPDGSWLAATVQSVAGDPPRYVTSIWRVGAEPGVPPARLTRSAEGEGGPEFLPDGSLLFSSRRPAPGQQPLAARTGTAERDGQPGDDGQPGGREAEPDGPALWLLPAHGGEARRILAPPGGVAAVTAARAAAAFACSVSAFPGTAGPQEDASRRKARKDAGVKAILHETGLLRYWDHDLGPDSLRLLAGEPPASAAASGADENAPARTRDLTPDAGRALDEQSFDLSPDGSVVAAGWIVPGERGEWRNEIVLLGTADGARAVLLSADDAQFGDPLISPDGALVLASRQELDTYERPGDVTLVVAALPAGGAAGAPASGGRDLLDGFDRQPGEAAWAPDGGSVFFTADDQGRRPVFRVALDGGEVTRVTGDAAAYDSLCPAPDGRFLYALRDRVDSPPVPVRIDLASGEVTELASPAAGLDVPGTAQVPGTLTEVSTTAADGTTIRAWLALPEGASAQAPAPLLLWVHGGPVSSWNAWSWRWNPWLMTARGYAVLLPDPALSTGYGQHMIQRGHGAWGENPFTDVMAITDAVTERPDIDADRTAMMGGSFGGYMANWIAGHTGRFRAIVSHAGLWALDQMFATTDWPAYWRRSFGDPDARPERYRDNSPDRHLAAITSPMLVIHGDKDYRVPVGEALRLWADLIRAGKTAKFLYFPDENHWILKPGDMPVWYETIFAFLAEHVLGEKWQRPDLL